MALLRLHEVKKKGSARRLGVVHAVRTYPHSMGTGFPRYDEGGPVSRVRTWPDRRSGLDLETGVRRVNNKSMETRIE